jgi:hypothetical protein
MKMNGAKMIMVGVFSVGAVLWSITTNAAPSVWPNQKGEICIWNDTTQETAKIAVEKTVGNNYTLQGVTNGEGEDPTLFTGNAILVGNNVYMNVTGSGYVPGYYDGFNNLHGDEVHGFVGTVRLNLDSNLGFVKVLSFHCVGEEGSDCGFGNDGTQDLEIIPCD